MNTIKPTFKSEALPLLLIIVAIIFSFYFYSVFPERVATHWNFEGEANGWSSKAIAAFAMPVVLIVMYLLFHLFPFLDPKKEKYNQFSKSYHVIKGTILSFIFVVYILASLEATGAIKAVGQAIPIMLALLFIIFGNYMSKIRSNWFIGIRTPWTLSSDIVWNKTHRMGGKLFILSGLLIGACPFLSASWQLPIFIMVILIISLGSVGYSYLAYRKVEGDKKKTRV